MHFYAIKVSDLEANFESDDLTPFVKSSLAYTTQSGGSWNPFVSDINAQGDKGRVLINNNTNFVLYVTEDGDLNKIVGYIDRKQLNAQMYLAANGLVDLVFYDVDSGTLIDTQQVGISKDSITRISIGEPQAIEYTTDLRIINNTNLHFNISNTTTDEPLYNENCNLCSTLVRASEGVFSVATYLTTSVKLQSTDGALELAFDVLPDSTTTLTYVIEVTDAGITARLMQTTVVVDGNVDIIAQAKSSCETAINAYTYNVACFDYIDYMGTAYSPTVEDSLDMMREACITQLSGGDLNSNQCMEYINQRAAGIYQNKSEYHEVFQLQNSCNYYLVSGIFTADCLRIYEF